MSPIQTFNNLRVSFKIYAAIGALLAVVIALMANVYSEQQAKIDYVEKQQLGLNYVESLVPLLRNVPVHRGMSNGYLSGNSSLKPKLDAQTQKVNTVLDEHAKINAHLAEKLGLEGRFNAIQRTWSKLSQSYSSMPAPKSFAEHSALIQEVINLAQLAAFNSQMLLDNNLDSYYLGNISVNVLPEMTNQYGILRGFGTGFSTKLSKGAIEDPSAGQAKIGGLIANISASFEKLDTQYKQAAAINTHIESSLRSIIRGSGDKTQAFLKMAQPLSSGANFSFQPSDYFETGTAAVDNLFALYGELIPLLRGIYSEQQATIESSLVTKMALIVFSILAAILFSVLVISSIVKPLERTKNYLSEIADENYENDISVDRKDEIGQMMQVLGNMQDQLKANIQSVKDEAAKSTRVKQGLDTVSGSVLLADANHQIIYLNDSVSRLFAKNEQDIQQSCTSFTAHNILGAALDVFSSLPDININQLSSSQEAYELRTVTGKVTLDLIANPVLDEHGERIGTVIEWIDRTQELKQLEAERHVAEENSRIRHALDSVTSKVVLADADLNVIYTNDAMQQALKTHESEFRTSAKDFTGHDIVGTPITNLHPQPQSQRELLNNLQGPQQSECQFGGRSMSYIASPVVNSDGKRAGTVIEWTDLTEEKAIESEIADIVQAAREGNLKERISMQGKDGFFATLAEGLNDLLNLNNQFTDDIGHLFDGMTNGDLTQTVNGEYKGDFETIKNDANSSLAKISDVLQQIAAASDSVMSGANEVAQGNDDLSQRTESQAANLQETASSMEEINSTVQESSKSSNEANLFATESREKAQNGGEVVQQAVTAMGEILDSSKKINDIIGVIDEIAFQTNLLALNAAVEAARAGEQGRGFAVVAGEVRTLSQRSAAAAKEIKDLIRDSVSKVEAGSQLVNESGETLSDIVSSVERVAGIIEQLNTAAKEQQAGIGQVNSAITQMDSTTQQNAALVEETSAAARTMSEQAHSMNRLVSFFKTTSASSGGTVSMQASALASSAFSAPATQSVPEPMQTEIQTYQPSTSGSSAYVADDDDESWEDF